ncbi:MAG: hypothetical protein P1P87_04460 [Trueperaceae bacterium]|nr:hypothetical protein [Trueperaceae bacterium]
MSARRWLVVTAVLIAVLIALAALAMALRPSEVAFDPDTPEGTVQRYVVAVIDGDLALARSTFAADLAARCPASSFAARVREGLWWGEAVDRDEWHVLLLETATLSDGQVRLRVRVERLAAAPPFDVGTRTSEHAFVLAFEDGAWRLTSFDWPSPCF